MSGYGFGSGLGGGGFSSMPYSISGGQTNMPYNLTGGQTNMPTLGGSGGMPYVPPQGSPQGGQARMPAGGSGFVNLPAYLGGGFTNSLPQQQNPFGMYNYPTLGMQVNPNQNLGNVLRANYNGGIQSGGLVPNLSSIVAKVTANHPDWTQEQIMRRAQNRMNSGKW